MSTTAVGGPAAGRGAGRQARVRARRPRATACFAVSKKIESNRADTGARIEAGRPGPMRITRRSFLRTSLSAGLALPAVRALPCLAAAGDALPRRESSLLALLRAGGSLPPPAPLLRRASVPGTPLALRYPDLARHFVFEYYPWYASDPFRHWQQDGRQPP